MKVLGINGIYSSGGRNTDLILSDLRAAGHECYDLDYPCASIFAAQSRKIQLRNARVLIDAHNPGDAVVAHSFGCLITLRAMELGARFGRVFFFSAAMNEDYTFPYHGMERLYNVFNPLDRALAFGTLVRWGDIGSMGMVGYQGPPDTRVKNWQAPIRRGGLLNHSRNYFDDENRPQVVRWMLEVLNG